MTAGAFDLTGPLPSGVTVLEASAGTGKTFTIAALAARYVADGVDLDSMLLVTFTRAATGELRERVRERLVVTERELGRVLASGEPSSGDELVRLLAADDLGLVALRRERLAHAIANFDAATIETTHGFCQKVLDELGTLAEIEPELEFVDNIDELVSEVVDDLYVRAFHKRDPSDPVRITRAQAGEIAALATDNPLAPVYPLRPANPNQLARRRLALAAREELDRRKQRLGIMTHDDQLTRLLKTFEGPNGRAAIANLRERYAVVLIDEFQDTDPLQWEIVERAFADGQRTLVLIGDPKQAIYAFRGADVYAYLAAARAAAVRATLDVNRRSDGPLLRAYDALFDGAKLGEADIVYRPVHAAPGHGHSQLSGAPHPEPLRFRVVDRNDPEVGTTPSGAALGPQAQNFVARDLALDIVALLSSRATIGEQVVQPGDIAVLVRSRWQAGLIQQALDDRDVPVVIAGAGSVFETAAAQDWLLLLEALERPASGPRARAAALTPFLGITAADLATADERTLELLHQRLHMWARMLRDHGVATLAQSVLHGEHVPGRLLGIHGGERRLTDLEHVAQLLHAAAGSEGFGVAALTSWLRDRIGAAAGEGSDERTRRLDTDADAVQVLTFHRSKGLEFPIVYCPYLWNRAGGDDQRGPLYFHDPEAGGARAIDVSCEGPEYEEHRRRFAQEEAGEDLRLIYVALTRARHQAVLWWAGSYFGKDAALTRLLFCKQLDGSIGLGLAKPPSDADALAALQLIAETAPGCVSVEHARLPLAVNWSGEIGPADELTAAAFDRDLDLQWRRTSYSAITAAAPHEALVSSEPESAGITDEPAADDGIVVAGAGVLNAAALAGAPLVLAAMAAGPALGTVIHKAMEEIDFTDPQLTSALHEFLVAETGRTPALLGCPPELAAEGLVNALRTPLGGDLGSLTLTEVPRSDRLDELNFELPLAGGDRPAGDVTLDRISALLREHLAADDPLVDYAERLTDPSLRGVMRGYLTGSIDLVLRTREARQQRFTVVDYKTNWLAPAGEELSQWHYRPAALAAEMQRSHYALQALLYSVALHRFLRWRLPDYAPERHLGGVRYLFIRGMTGPGSTGQAPGVFIWNPPAGMIAALSDLLDGTSTNGGSW